MKTIYQDDALSGGGHGFLIFSEFGEAAPPLSYALMRASDRQFATGRSWVGEKAWLPAGEEPGPDGALQVAIGPGLVDALDMQETYAVFLKGADGNERRSRLQIQSITYSPDDALDNTGSRETPGKPEAESAPPQAKPVQKAVEEPPAKIAMPAPARPPRRRMWRWLIFFLLALGCLAWFALDPRRNMEEPEKPAGPVRIEEPAKEAAGAQNARNASDRSVSGRVRLFFQGGNATPEGAVALFRELPKNTPQEQDAAYRLLYYAYGQGAKALLMDYGACLDPAKPRWGSIEKNAPAAWEAYGKAQQAGQEGAEQARAALLAWLKREAPANARAREWLAEIQ